MLEGYCMHTGPDGKMCGRWTTTMHPRFSMSVCHKHVDCMQPPPGFPVPAPVSQNPPARDAILVVDVCSERADFWVANNLLTLWARVDGRIELWKLEPGPVVRMVLIARDLTDEKLLRKWEEVRNEASGGARNGP